MLEALKKIFNVLMNFPAISNLFRKAVNTGKLDPLETIEALSTLSPSTKKVTDTAMKVAANGGNVKDAMQAVTNIGEIEIFGQKINTRTMINDLERAGGACSLMANILKKMPNQPISEINDFGEKVFDLKNWKDIINQN